MIPEDLNNPQSTVRSNFNESQSSGLSQQSSTRQQLLEKQKQMLINKYKMQQNAQTSVLNQKNNDMEFINIKQENIEQYEPGQNKSKPILQLQKIDQKKIIGTIENNSVLLDDNIELIRLKERQKEQEKEQEIEYQRIKDIERQKEQQLEQERIQERERYLEIENQKNLEKERILEKEKKLEKERILEKEKQDYEKQQNNQNDQQKEDELVQNERLSSEQKSEEQIIEPKNDLQIEQQLYDIRLLDQIPLKQFLESPIPYGKTIQLQIRRDKQGFNRFTPRFYLYDSKEHRVLMCSKKKSLNKTSNYALYSNKDEKKENFVGKVRSNFLGTEFLFYDTGVNPKDSKVFGDQRKVIGGVIYVYFQLKEQNIFGTKGPRKMQVILPEWEKDAYFTWRFDNEKETLINQYRLQNGKWLKMFFNKPPKWNESFVLNFNGRVDKPSVKNFQLIDDQDDSHIYLQFGRQGDDLFSLDFTYPFSPIQAFSIALSSFDYKIACE